MTHFSINARIAQASLATTALLVAAVPFTVPTAHAAEGSKFDLSSTPLMSSAIGKPVGPEATQHDGAPTPVPFDESYLVGYDSDISSYKGGNYIEVVDGFDDLRARHDDALIENAKKSVQINNDAENDPERVKAAQQDALAAKEGVLFAVSESLGPEAGQALVDALHENRLPKTNFLIGNGYLGRAGGIASSTFFEKKHFDYDRPLVQMPDKIKRYPMEGADIYDVEGQPSFPSGHTNQATWITTSLAMMLPEMGPQILERGAISGESRVVLGVHYPLDVIGGRMTGQAAAADRWNDPKMRDAFEQAGQELRAELEWRTGKTIEQLAAENPVSSEQAVNHYTELMTYGFEQVEGYDHNAPMNVPATAPALLATRFPELNDEQRAEVIRQTALPSGYPLDKAGEQGSWQRVNLAAAWTADVTVNDDGSVTVAK